MSERESPLKRGQCCWVLSSPRQFPVDYCRKPTRYRMVPDDDRNVHRVYNPFCAEHMKKAAEQDAEDE